MSGVQISPTQLGKIILETAEIQSRQCRRLNAIRDQLLAARRTVSDLEAQEATAHREADETRDLVRQMWDAYRDLNGPMFDQIRKLGEQLGAAS